MKHQNGLRALGLWVITTAIAQGSVAADATQLSLPAEWSVTPLMAPTQTMGLQVSSFIIHEPDHKVRQWRQQHMADCRLPAGSDEDDWHCFDQHHIFSLLWREEGFIWVLSKRLARSSPGFEQHALPANLAGLDAQVLSHSESLFESVTLLHSRRSLYGLQRDLLRLYDAQGARLVMQEQDAGGFIQQWQHLQHKVTYTAHKDEQGAVLLVKVRGTTL
ncbi:MAG: hypothetical protein JJU03_13680 [Idiomarina sp.]|nr:hypothetical protein [Idiomarina sp.]